MKTFEEYRFTIKHNDIKIGGYRYHPKDKNELKEIIEKEIELQGNTADLNCIDVSKITNMSLLFERSDFNGDISKWNVSNVTNMSCMFMNSEFNGDISKWNVSNVKDMSFMFCESKFNQDISMWNVNRVEYIENIFEGCSIKEEYIPEGLE